ncbi:MAG: YihY/virulence factor BrkB family protein [Thermomicrobiales bacterium]|nr:YihY/virulence factor BrkB family protein [Thermomicrobiales bacterium]
MVLRIGGVVAGRGGIPLAPEAAMRTRRQERARGLAGWIDTTFHWMLRGYQQANAGDLAAAVAYNALVALIPTFLLCLSVAGLFFRSDEVFTSTIYASLWGLPSSAAGDSLEAVLTAKRSSSWLGALSLAGFAWTGAGFVGCLARSMNRIYGVPGCGYMCEKRRGFFVILAFAALFILALVASTVPTFFVRTDLPAYFESWALAAGWYQVLGYVVAFAATVALFGMLYRVVPNAGQRLLDIWPGTLAAATLFVVMAQVFPLYLRLIGGANRYGAAFGLLTLLVAWFYVLAHLLLFGAYINATHQRHRRRQRPA